MRKRSKGNLQPHGTAHAPGRVPQPAQAPLHSPHTYYVRTYAHSLASYLAHRPQPLSLRRPQTQRTRRLQGRSAQPTIRAELHPPDPGGVRRV